MRIDDYNALEAFLNTTYPAPVRLMRGDCLERMADVAAGSVDLILTDPPYGTVKGLGKGTTFKMRTEWDDTIPHKEMTAACHRLLRPNGALVLFSQDPYTFKLATDYEPAVPFSYRLVWEKNHFGSPLNCKKVPVNYTEDINIFFKDHPKHDHKGFHPLRPYAESVMGFIGKAKREVFRAMGHEKLCHFTRFNSSQFSLCTEQTYNELMIYFAVHSMPGFIPYGALRPVDVEYRRDLQEKMSAEFPKVFNLPAGKKFKSNILKYGKDGTGHHPTQKPVALLEDLIRTYTNPGATVLDFTMGSGSTGVAARNLSRTFIGIERDEEYFSTAIKRIHKL